MTMPVWGCPWHGKVQGGKLTLPNAEQLTWPTLSQTIYGSERVGIAESRMLGDTSLVQVPGVLPPERTEEELADDALHGRQWWGSAVLSGALRRIHGKATNGWIYCDPDGGRWRVQAPLSTLMWNFDGVSWTVYHANRFGGSLTLSRFGDLSGSASSRAVSFAVEDLTIGADRGPGRSGYMQLRTVSPDGSRAIYALTCVAGKFGFDTGDARADQVYYPEVFVELSLSGSGEEIQVAAQVVRTREQVRGQAVRQVVDSTLAWQAWWIVYDGPDNVGDNTVYTANLVSPALGDPFPPNAPGIYAPDNESLGSGNFGALRIITETNRIMALWYAPDGQLQQLDLCTVTDETTAVTAPAVSVSGTVTINGAGERTDGRGVSISSRSSDQAISYVARLCRGAEVLAETSINRTISSSTQYNYFGELTTVTTQDSIMGDSTSQSPGVSITGTSAPSTGVVGAGVNRLFVGDLVTVWPYEHASHCWSLMTSDERTDRLTWSACATPSGQSGLPVDLPWADSSHVMAVPVLHGSWCPVTHQVARDTAPACWT